jgi:HKD family nuclease
MHFYNTQQLLEALERRLREAKSVDIAVAWAWSCSALELLDKAASRGVKIRAMVGLDGNWSQPTALRSLAGFADVRIASDLGRIFHPKVFIFRSPHESIGWVGSANLTTGGFVRNVEGVIEVADPTEAEEWFNELWARLAEDPMPAIEKYERDWVPPQRGPTKPKNSEPRV